MNEARASGTLIAKEREVLESIVGREVVARALRSLPDYIQDEYNSVGPMTKIATLTVETVYEAVAHEAGRDVMRMHRELVRTSVEAALKTLWRILLRFTSDEALVRRTPLFFSRGLSRGKLTSRIVSPGSAEIRLTDWPGVSDMQINGIAAAAETVLSCAGRENVRVDGQRTLDGACMIARWHV